MYGKIYKILRSSSYIYLCKCDWYVELNKYCKLYLYVLII